MSTELGRIWFADNPWPNGHAIAEFLWLGRLERDGSLWFELHLETEDYDASAPPVCDGPSDWRSSIVWSNYGRCTLSSAQRTIEGGDGLLVGGVGAPFQWSAMRGLELTADRAQQGDEVQEDLQPAFRIYLLGHDAVADHRVLFSDSDESGAFDIEWSGRIALSYVRCYSLDYHFRAAIHRARFDGFSVPPELTDEHAWALFAAACMDAAHFELINRSDGRVFRPS